MQLSPIKHHKTEIDKQGKFREYTVYKEEDFYIFDCWDCVMSENNSSHCKRSAYEKSNNIKDAILKYEEYLEVWEPKEI